MSTSSQAANRQIARAAGTVMAAALFNNLTNLASLILNATTYGAQVEMDAFLAANRVSETLFVLMAGGALGSAFIPTFTGLLAKEDRPGAWQLASAIANLLLMILVLLAILAAIFARPIVRYALAPGLAADPAVETLTVNLLRLMLPSAVIFGLSGLVMGILNAHQVFFVPALTPALYRLGMIFGVLVLAPRLGIYGLAWGVVIGASLHLLLQIPSLLRLQGQYLPTLGLRLPVVREVALLMGPRLFGVAVVQLNFWVNLRLASYMERGSMTAITWGLMIMLMPQAIIAQSVATAAMPTLATQYALGKLDDIRLSLAASLRGILMLALPASIGLILLRQPVVALLLQYGKFDAHSTQLIAWALLWYAAGLVGHCIVEILARAFYAMHDTKTPVLIGSLAMGLNIVFSILFSRGFTLIGWAPHGGLALANSLATALEALGLLVWMRRRLGRLQGRQILASTAQAVGAGGVMAAGIFLWLALFPQQPTWFVASLGVFLGASLYAASLLMMKVPEVRGLARRIGHLLRKKSL